MHGNFTNFSITMNQKQMLESMHFWSTSLRASDTFVGLIFSRLEKLQKIALMVSNMKSRACLLRSVAFVYNKILKLYFQND